MLLWKQSEFLTETKQTISIRLMATSLLQHRRMPNMKLPKRASDRFSSVPWRRKAEPLGHLQRPKINLTVHLPFFHGLLLS